MVTKKKKTASSASRSRTRHITKTPTHFMVKRSLISYAVIVFIFFGLLSMSAYLVDRMIVSRGHQLRYNEIVKIYRNLNLDDSYRVASSNIFGDKRNYEYDKGRSYASSMEYGRNATLTDTVNDLRSKAEKAGFSYVQTEYEGSVSPVHQYKNSRGHWLRIQVEPSVNHDDAVYGTKNFKFESTEQVQPMSPVYVTIKVNLDNNNE